MITAKDSIDTREEKARLLAGLGLVTRNRDRFEVTVPDIIGEPERFYVWRADDGRVCCTCSEAENAVASNFRCCHMLAVKFAIKLQNSEPTKRRSASRPNSGNVVDFATGLSRPERSEEPNGSVEAVAEGLSSIDPRWSHAVREVREVGKFVVVTVALSVNGVTREGIGTGVHEADEGFVLAEASALRQAAAKFDVTDDPRAEAVRDPIRAFPSNPIARSLFDLVTAKQLGMIRAMGREIGIKADDECRAVMNCTTDELSKRAASALIQHLGDLRNQRFAGQMRLAG